MNNINKCSKLIIHPSMIYEISSVDNEDLYEMLKPIKQKYKFDDEKFYSILSNCFNLLYINILSCIIYTPFLCDGVLQRFYQGFSIISKFNKPNSKYLDIKITLDDYAIYLTDFLYSYVDDISYIENIKINEKIQTTSTYSATTTTNNEKSSGDYQTKYRNVVGVLKDKDLTNSNVSNSTINENTNISYFNNKKDIIFSKKEILNYYIELFKNYILSNIIEYRKNISLVLED